LCGVTGAACAVPPMPVLRPAASAPAKSRPAILYILILLLRRCAPSGAFLNSGQGAATALQWRCNGASA
jgi:hypothetical protein